MTSMVVDMERMRVSAAEAVNVLRSLANEDRLLLLCELSHGERCVSELEELLGIHQPSLSQQLGVLRREGLAATRRDGKRIYYRVADRRVVSLLQTMYATFCPDARKGEKGS